MQYYAKSMQFLGGYRRDLEKFWDWPQKKSNFCREGDRIQNQIVGLLTQINIQENKTFFRHLISW